MSIAEKILFAGLLVLVSALATCGIGIMTVRYPAVQDWVVGILIGQFVVGAGLALLGLSGLVFRD